MKVQNPKAQRKDAAYSDAIMQAVQLHSQGWLDDAEKIYEAVLKARPNHFDAKQLLGDLRFRQGRLAEAEVLLRKAISLNGMVPAVHLALGKTLAAMNRHADAVAAFDKAIALQPQSIDAHFGRGYSMRGLQRYDEALASFRKVVDINPQTFEAINACGVVLRAMLRLDEALACFDQALAVKPDYIDALSNRGSLLADLGRPAEARLSFDKALALNPDFADARHNYGLFALLMGELAEGWTGCEARFSCDVTPLFPFFGALPVWSGEDPRGKHILVIDEQGAGDVIQFFRYLILLAAKGATVTFLVRPGLVGLLSTQDHAVRIVTQPDGESYDYQIALMSLPGAFKTTLETIPPAIPYIQPDPVLVGRWAARLGGDGLKVGIAWQGNSAARVDVGRSIPLKCFAPLAAIPGVRLISLQKGYGTEQLDDLSPGMQVETLGADFDSGPNAFIDTAAVMANLDLVITSDTSIAHLAATLQRPTWLALKYMPDWRWMLERTDSPWYPTMRLYRQTSRGDWDGVFERISADLAGFPA